MTGVQTCALPIFVTVNPKTGETLYTSSPAQFEQFRQELEQNLAKG